MTTAGRITLPSRKRNEIQWLRAIAACEVVVCHSDLVVKHFSDDRILLNPWYSDLGGIGVELFFVISGYIMCMRAPLVDSYGGFIWSRISRIYPLYWLFTSVVVVITTIVPIWQPGGPVWSIKSLARSYLVLPEWGFPILGVGWTLEYEMIFYTLVTLMMAFGMISGRRLVPFGFFLAGLGSVGCVIGYKAEGSAMIFHILTPYMFAFGAGWLLRSVELATWRMWILSIVLYTSIVAAVAWIGSDWGAHLLFRISIAACVFYSFLLGRQVFQADNVLNRILWLIGDASFSLYLSHWFVLSASGKILGALKVQAEYGAIARSFGILVCVAAGVAVFRYVEKPLHRSIRGRVIVRQMVRRPN